MRAFMRALAVTGFGVAFLALAPASNAEPGQAQTASGLGTAPVVYTIPHVALAPALDPTSGRDSISGKAAALAVPGPDFMKPIPGQVLPGADLGGNGSADIVDSELESKRPRSEIHMLFANNEKRPAGAVKQLAGSGVAAVQQLALGSVFGGELRITGN